MSDKAMRVLSADRVADIIQVDTIRVTRADMAKAERVAKGDRLARLVAESVHALAIVAEREEKNLAALVDSYRAVGDPIVVAIRDGLSKGVRDFVRVAVNGETVPSGKYRNEPRYTRGYRIADSWTDGETTAQCVARFVDWCETNGKGLGISEFVSWIGGGKGSKPKDAAKDLRAALRAFYRSGGTLQDAQDVALETWGTMGE